MNVLFWLVMARVAGLFAGAPVFSLTSIPVRYRVLVTAVLSAALLPLASTAPLPTGPDVLVAAMLGEFMIGFAIGLIARLLLTAFQIAGTIMGFQMGMAMANQFDPSTNAQSALIGTLHLNLVTVLFLLVDGHHMLIRGVAASYETLPIGTPLRADVLASVVSDFGGAVWTLGARVAAPVTGVMLLVNVILGFLNRVNPQLSIFNVGFPLTSATGLVALMLAIPGTVEAFVTSYETLREGVLDLIGG